MNTNKITLEFIKGIPFLLSTEGTVYYYDTKNPEPTFVFGKYNRETNELQLDTDWRERFEETYAKWKESVVPTQRGQISRAVKPSKQNKPRRNYKRKTKDENIEHS